MRTTNAGTKICNLRIATSDQWKDRHTGERKEATEWHSVTIFNENLAGIAEQYLRKGSKVYLQGKLKTRKWTDQAGVEKYSTEVVFEAFNATMILLDGRSSGGDEDRGEREERRPAGRAPQGGGGKPSYDDGLDDEIPFSKREYHTMSLYRHAIHGVEPTLL